MLPTWAIITIVAVIFLFVIGNILMVKESANMKMPDLLGKQKQANQEDQDKLKQENHKND
ncbi:DUF2897 family protein [Aliidiomarina quisquiliarum]|uniref:DUF2897 family protein n=1 Tax=Aliidiomarina quisquiliarum TaxID=2938947 RepID=UPI00208FB324|nr:DUF2897 family protein [Aliidiomarina quisquiliarum]MCO4320488.1 DUF2897 family protein [Aliidiomarina quisquiliarum]